MKPWLLAAAVAVLTVTSAPAQEHKHVMLLDDTETKWVAAPPVLPKGAEISVLWGDPSKEGPFVMRAKFPPNYKVPPHSHPVDEIVTVISGDFNLGFGREFDDAKTSPIKAGGFIAMTKGMEHFVTSKGGAVIQISTVGPWGLNYVNPADDPRKSQ